MFSIAALRGLLIRPKVYAFFPIGGGKDLVTATRTKTDLIELINQLVKHSSEAEWLEFKCNNADPKEIGSYISALANSTALLERTSAFLIWGIDDQTRSVIGTEFHPSSRKIGNEQLENWLLRMLSPKVFFQFFELELDGLPVVLLEIQPSPRQPVRFAGEAFIRVGSYKKKLKDHPERERSLWRLIDRGSFEKGVAAERLLSSEIHKLLDIQSYYQLLNCPEPSQQDSILTALELDGMIARGDTGRWNILNLGALLLARRLKDFDSLKRKSVRVVVYRGSGRFDTIREQEGTMGYANGFEGVVSYIQNLLPSHEVIENAIRKNATMYPELAVRELVANALIHQDFSISGAGPMIEIFDNRLEVTNPGAPLVDTRRFLDCPPRSRNEILASFMRRAGVCEERGSGIDKIVSQTEIYQLPAPLFETPGENTRATLFAHQPMGKMDREARVRACYLHTCLRYVIREDMSNSTLRNRFGLEVKDAPMVSRIIRDTVDAQLIRAFDDTVGTRAKRYVPYWA